MMTMKNPENDTQIDKFRDLAREFECDDVEAAFDERLRRLAMASGPMSGEEK